MSTTARACGSGSPKRVDRARARATAVPARRDYLQSMDTIRIPNAATYAPVALSDVIALAPLATRVLFRFSPLGRAVQAAAIGAYAGSALMDWMERRNIRRIDFHREFGADVDRLDPMPEACRRDEVEELGLQLTRGFTSEHRPRKRLAVDVDRHLTEAIASITGQRVESSIRIRAFGMASLVFPFAMGSCDVFSGDVAIYRDTGFFEPHLIAHEFAHRKGYWKELHAQVLAYLALSRSGDPLLVQSARLERLHRNLKVLAEGDRHRYLALVDFLDLPPDLGACLRALWPEMDPVSESFARAMKELYDQRMRMTGQNGLSDYDEGFTSFLHTWEGRSTRPESRPARPDPPSLPPGPRRS